MARKRYISSDISIDERIAAVANENPIAALMWPWFIKELDDWGRMIASPLTIKLLIFPAFPYDVSLIEDAIQLYKKYNLIHLYEQNGNRYLAMDPEEFYRLQPYIHQNKRYDDKSTIPAPVDAPWCNNEAPRNSAEPREVSRNLAGSREVSRKIVPSPSPSPSPSESIDTDSDLSSPPDVLPEEGGMGGETGGDDGSKNKEPVNFVNSMDNCELFKQELRRPLTPVETEVIIKLEKIHGRELVTEALHRAVAKRKLNIAYVEGILNDWASRNLSTLPDVLNYEKRVRKRRKPRNRGDPDEDDEEKQHRKALIKSLYLS